MCSLWCITKEKKNIYYYLTNARPPTFRSRFHIDVRAHTHTIVYINIEVDREVDREVDIEVDIEVDREIKNNNVKLYSFTKYSIRKRSKK